MLITLDTNIATSGWSMMKNYHQSNAPRPASNQAVMTSTKDAHIMLLLRRTQTEKSDCTTVAEIRHHMIKLLYTTTIQLLKVFLKRLITRGCLQIALSGNIESLTLALRVIAGPMNALIYKRWNSNQRSDISGNTTSELHCGLRSILFLPKACL